MAVRYRLPLRRPQCYQYGKAVGARRCDGLNAIDSVLSRGATSLRFGGLVFIAALVIAP
jgi:hypothetical protein